MKLTKKMEALIDKRARLAAKLMSVGIEVDEMIESNGLENEIADYDWRTGFEMYCNPYDSAERIKEAIRNKED